MYTYIHIERYIGLRGPSWKPAETMFGWTVEKFSAVTPFLKACYTIVVVCSYVIVTCCLFKY